MQHGAEEMAAIVRDMVVRAIERGEDAVQMLQPVIAGDMFARSLILLLGLGITSAIHADVPPALVAEVLENLRPEVERRIDRARTRAVAAARDVVERAASDATAHFAAERARIRQRDV